MSDVKKTRTGIEVIRKDRESVGSLTRRFSQKVRQSKRLVIVREKRFRQPKKNKIARRKSALVRAERRIKYKELRKWGKVK